LHGKKYVSIGFGFSKGSFTAFSLDHESIREDLAINEQPNPTSFNYVCHQSKLPAFVIPMYKIQESSDLGKKLSKSMDFLHITSSFKEEWRKNLFIGKIHLEDYDYLVYFKDTNHSKQISLN
jgi:hypothetical protein